MYILRGKAFPSRALRCALPLPAGTPRNAPSAARLYERIQNPRDRYLRRLKKIPTPEFYVFYNGEDDYPETATLPTLL